jgi:23S rRNA pseudouridine1911/1915/1917 synthase
MSKRRRGKDRPVATPAPSPPPPAVSSEGIVLSKTQKRKLQKRRAAERQRQAAAATRGPPPSSARTKESPASAASLGVVHEDEHLIAINKPVGLLCHPSPGFWDHGTVVHALAARERTAGYSEIGVHMLEARRSHTGEADSFIPRAIVHRLDRGTSGLMLIAKSELAEERLTEQFKRRGTSKTYVALLCGAPRHTAAPACSRIQLLDGGASFRVDAPIEADPSRPGKMIVGPRGKEAASIVHVHAHSMRGPQELCLVSVELLTGRQHQIRVHCAQCLGAPLANDSAYNGARLAGVAKNRPLLHAWAMNVPHPAARGADAPPPLDVRAPLPGDMLALIAQHFPELVAADPSSWPRLNSPASR